MKNSAVSPKCGKTPSYVAYTNGTSIAGSILTNTCISPSGNEQNGRFPPLEIGEFFSRFPPPVDERTAGVCVNELTSILTAIKLAAKVVNREINKANTFGLDAMRTVHQDRDIAAFANRSFLDALTNRQVVAGIASIMEDGITTVAGCEDKSTVVVVHPMDGTKQIDVNISTGTLFSIYKRISTPGQCATVADFLQRGKQQLCAGYVIYGSSTMLVCTMGNGTHGFTMDPGLGTFYLSNRSIQMPLGGDTGANIYSINSGKRGRFPQGVKAYISHAQEKQYPCRYIGSMVADFHRNMLKGGIYIYPPTYTDPRPTVNMVFQCFPLAFLAEQAGGKASDGFTRILLIEPTSLMDRVCFVAGSTKMVEDAEEFMARHKIRDDFRQRAGAVLA